jgi:hypothetical protein
VSDPLLKNENALFGINSEEKFILRALETFRYQHAKNPVYRRWCDLLSTDPGKVTRLNEIPFLPIKAFRDFEVVCGEVDSRTIVFKSSTTTSQLPSKHLVQEIDLYEKSFLEGFRHFYGDPAGYCILALLPGYLERSDSSLVYMCDRLIKDSGNSRSGFYLNEFEKLVTTVKDLKAARVKTILIGVSYALMDICKLDIRLSEDFIVIETGGMKGRRKEMLKPELHAFLKEGLGVGQIHSEYGMTEMLSQAYSKADGLFESPPWLRFIIREIEDPFRIQKEGKTGGVSVIDLANLHSCSFIATQDLGRLHGQKLELMGRYDDSDVRGCNLMVG